jgi:transcriptional regulator with XRE-family HTH domain
MAVIRRKLKTGGNQPLATKELNNFLIEQCESRKLTLRGLSIKAGLSPGTVHNLLKRNYQPTLFTLNQLADYLGVQRPYLWQLAGLLEDMDYDAATTIEDPQLKFHFSRVAKLPASARSLVISLIQAVIIFLEKQDNKPT